MMKITVNSMKRLDPRKHESLQLPQYYTRLSGLVMLGVLGLSGCAPIPQAYPAAPQQQRPSVNPQVHNVPQAAPLLPNKKPLAAQRYVAAPIQRPRPVQRAQPVVPPTLQPAQQQQRARQIAAAKAAKQAAIRRQAQQRAQQRQQQSRPSPAKTYRPPTVRKAPPAVAPAKDRSVPGTTTQSTTKWEAIEARQRPASTPVQQQNQQSVAVAPVQKKTPVVEVLDLSSPAKKPVNKPVVEKVVPPPASYKNSPAVVILIKQANNQLVVGKKDQAASTLERALRIAPENPMLWLRLAEVNEQQGNKTQAASMAKKAIGLAPDDANIRQRGSRLVN